MLSTAGVEVFIDLLNRTRSNLPNVDTDTAVYVKNIGLIEDNDLKHGSACLQLLRNRSD